MPHCHFRAETVARGDGSRVEANRAFLADPALHGAASLGAAETRGSTVSSPASRRCSL